MSNTFTARELTKRGLVRRPDWDFRDDGTTFRCYEYKGFRVTYTKWTSNRDEVLHYLSVDINYSERGLIFDDVHNTAWYPLADLYNGVHAEEIDMDVFMRNFDIIEKGLEDALAAAAKDIPSADEIQKYVDKEIERAEVALQYFKVNYDWYNSSDLSWDLARAKSFAKNIEDSKKTSCKDIPLIQLREIEHHIREYGYAYNWLNPKWIYEAVENHMI